MNETKRQLDKWMGDTTERTKEVMKMVERNKGKHARKKKRSFAPLYGVIATVVALLALVFTLDAFNNRAPDTNIPVTSQHEETPNEETSFADEYRQYFKKDQDIAYFEGDGIEFSTFTETTNWLSDNYVSITIDNGGATTQSIYRITDTKLAKILYEHVDTPKLDYTNEELEALSEIEILFEGPIKNSEPSDEKTITTNVTFDTPYQTFDNAVVIKEMDDNATNETVYAPGYGLIGTVFTAADGYRVTSLLASITSTP